MGLEHFEYSAARRFKIVIVINCTIQLIISHLKLLRSKTAAVASFSPVLSAEIDYCTKTEKNLRKKSSNKQ